MVNALYNNCATEPVSDYTVSPSVETALTLDNTAITITYGGKQTTVPITIKPLAKTLVLTANPTKTEYLIGENFDASGMIISADDGTNVVALNSSEYTIVGGENLSLASNYVTVVLNEDENSILRVPISVSTGVMEFNNTAGVYSNVTLSGPATATYRNKDDALANAALNKTYLSNLRDTSTVTYVYTSAVATKADLVLCASTAAVKKYGGTNNKGSYPMETFDMQANKMFKLYVNGVEYAMSDDVIFRGEKTTNTNGELGFLGNFMEQVLANVDLVAGET